MASIFGMTDVPRLVVSARGYRPFRRAGAVAVAGRASSFSLSLPSRTLPCRLSSRRHLTTVAQAAAVTAEVRDPRLGGDTLGGAVLRCSSLPSFLGLDMHVTNKINDSPPLPPFTEGTKWRRGDEGMLGCSLVSPSTHPRTYAARKPCHLGHSPIAAPQRTALLRPRSPPISGPPQPGPWTRAPGFRQRPLHPYFRSRRHHGPDLA